MIKIEQITSPEQEEILNRKMDERLDVIALTHPSHPKFEENKILTYEMCRDIKTGFQYFANNFCWIQDPEATTDELKELPFLLYDYQEKAATAIIDAIVPPEGRKVEKS